jgi:hypothetical protein
MKKFLALLLALLMCVGVLASCGGNTDDAAAATLDEAKELLNSMMKDKNGKATPNDYDVVGKLTVGETTFEVTWKTDKENIKIKASSKKDFWTVDVPDVNEAEVEYKLIATIKAADGSTVDVTFTPKLPVVDNAGIASDFEAGVAYVMFMKQANLGYTVYALNTTQNGENKYIETTMDPKAAAVFYVEVVDGGYKLYTEINGVKNYLHAELKEADGGKMSKYIGLKADSNCVFTYDKELTVFKITLNGGEYGVGTYNSFETISLSDATYFKKDNINVEGGQFPVGLMTKAHADTLAPSEKPANNDPKADSTLSIADAIALGKSKAPTVYTDGKYYVEGTVKEIQNDQYGNLVITDGTNDLLIYGTWSEDGKTRFDKLESKPAVGDKIKVYGIIGNYNNNPQMKNGWIIGANAGEGGDTPVAPSVSTELVEAPVVGTAYKFGMVQTAAGKTVYLKGGMDGFYMATTQNAAEAIDVYLEETTGGYYLYTMAGTTKTYINMVVNEEGTHINGAYEATAKTVYTLDATLKTIVSAITGTADAAKDGAYAFGTRNDKTYTTMGPVYADATKSFIAQFYTVAEGEGGDTPVVPTPPACTEHADANGDFICDTADCDVVVEPAADSVLTIEQANALGVALKGNYSANKYTVTGTIKDVYNTQYGNMHIKDANGVEFTVYGVNGYSAMAEKPVAGDVITVYAEIGSYSGVAQMKNADMTDLQHTHVFENGECACGAADPDFVPTHTCVDEDGDFTCDEADCDKAVLPAADSVLTVKQALALAAVLGENEYTEAKYYVTGVVASTPNATHGNLDLTADGETIYIYGLWDSTGANKYGNMAEKPVKGDTITVYTVIGNYNGSAQMKNAWVTELVPHGDNHTYEGGVCTVCGASEPVAGATTLNVAMSDVATANGWVDATQYTEFDADANITVSVTGGGNTGKYYVNGNNWRIYQNESPAITIAAANGKTIKSVKISYTINNNGVLTLNGNNVENDTLVTVDAASITFGVGNTSTKTNGQVRITAIEIIYQ